MSGLHEFDPAVGGHPLGIDVVHALAAGRDQGALERRDGDRLPQFAVDAPEIDLDPPKAAAESERGQPAELFAQAQEGCSARARGTERQIHRRHRERAAERRKHHASGLRGDSLLRLGGLGADVRRGHHLRVGRESVVRRRLLRENVQARPRELAGLERGEQGLGVDHTAAAHIDDRRAVLHQGDARFVEHVPGLVGEWGVEGDEVGPREQVVQCRRLDIETARDLSLQKGVVGERFHLEGPGTGRHPLADLTEADHAQRLALQLAANVALALPALRLERRVGRRNPPRERQQQGERVLGGRERIRRRRVDHQYAALRRGCDVDVVHADAGAAHHLEAIAALQHLARDLRSATHDDGVVVRDQLGQSWPVRVPQFVDLGALAQNFDACRRQRIGNQNPLHRKRIVAALQEYSKAESHSARNSR